jgi:hypothetical protein
MLEVHGSEKSRLEISKEAKLSRKENYDFSSSFLT